MRSLCRQKPPVRSLTYCCSFCVPPLQAEAQTIFLSCLTGSGLGREALSTVPSSRSRCQIASQMCEVDCLAY